MKHLLIILFFYLSIEGFGQKTYIPDFNFEFELEAMGLGDGSYNDSVLTSKVDTLISLYLNEFSSVNDFTGIEDFTNLEYFKISPSGVVQVGGISLDLSNNMQLKSIDIQESRIGSIILPNTTSLVYLNLSGNGLSDIDISNNPNLTYVDFSNNYNLPSFITFNANPLLEYLNLSLNTIDTIDLSNNSSLNTLEIISCSLEKIFFPNNSQLETLSLSYTWLTELNLSGQTMLKYVDCSYNDQLTCLNFKNGNNTNVISFTTFSCPSLTCLEVDDVTYSNTIWTDIDATTYFSSNCNNYCSGNSCNNSSNFTTINNGNGNYTFTNTSLGSFNQSHWAFGDGTTSLSISPNHTFTTNGTFTVVLTINDSSNNCFDYYMDTIIVNGVLTPTQCGSGFVTYPDTSNGNIIVVNTSTGTNLTYFWDFGDGDTSTQAYPTHIYATTGPFYLCLTVDDGSGCNDMFCDSIAENGVVFKTGGFTINVIAPPIISGVENNLKLSSEVVIYPNPTSNQLTIDTKLDIGEKTIIDITGKLIKTIKQNTNDINVADLSNGIYFIKLVTDERTITKKFVKQ